MVRPRSSVLPRTIPSLVLLVCCACQGTPPTPDPGPPGPLQPPAGSLDLRLRPGTIVGGRGVVGEEDGEAVHATVRLYYVQGGDYDATPALAPRTRLVLDTLGVRPLQPSSRLVPAARIAGGTRATDLLQRIEGEVDGRSTLVGEAELALFPATTLELWWRGEEVVPDPDNFLREWPERAPVEKIAGLALDLEPGDGGARPTAALLVQDLEPVPPGESRPIGPPSEEVLRERIVLADRPLAGSGPLLVLFDSPFFRGEGQHFAAVFEVEEGSPDEALVASSQLLLLEAGPTTEQVASGLVDDADAARALAAAFPSLVDAAELRGSLVALADLHGAAAMGDVALAAPGKALPRIAEVLVAEGAAAAPDSETLAWIVERSAWRFLARRAEERELEPALRAVMTTHAGELGRFPSSIAELLLRARGPDNLQEHLEAENRLFLEDSNLSARVRAFDWLTARGLAPEGFDPWAGKEERRAALVAAEEARLESEGSPAGDTATPATDAPGDLQ